MNSITLRERAVFYGAWEYTYVGNGDGFTRVSEIFEHVLDEDGPLSDGAL